MSYILEVRDSDPKQFILDIAEEFNSDFEENDNEYCVNIPKNLGSGFIKSNSFSNGISVLEFSFTVKKELIFKFKKGLVHPLKIIFNREAMFIHQFDEVDDKHKISKLESIILSSTPHNNHIFKIPSDQIISFISLEINRKLFENKIESFLKDMNDDLMKLFRDVNGTNIFYHKDYYSLDIAKYLEEFTDCELDDFMKVVFQEGKAYEILSHQLQQYIDDLNSVDNRTILRQVTLDKVAEATKLIKSDLKNVDNIVNIAKNVGLNQNTLQLGFKRLYKMSVNEYIKNERIQKAKELLETTDLNITEITYKVGINSRSYFSKLFKQKYGQAPKKYFNQLRSKEK